jgi:hypothetical protein
MPRAEVIRILVREAEKCSSAQFYERRKLNDEHLRPGKRRQNRIIRYILAVGF